MEMIYPSDCSYINLLYDKMTIFLAGSIGTGKADNWQELIGNELTDYDVRLLNPRRHDWDSSWEQSIDNPQFRQQVEWEMRGMDVADLIFFNFLPDTKAPITLLELGLQASGHTDIIVCCPDGFWRKGNVDIVCDKYAIELTDSFNNAIEKIHQRINNYNG
jgi:hypothetical protein